MDTQVLSASLDNLLQDVIRTSGLSLTYTLEPQPPGSIPLLAVEFDGADAELLVAQRAELLLALEHVAAAALRLEPEQHDLIRFESRGFKAQRDRELHEAAQRATQMVRETGTAYKFAPMSPHERRQLHIALASSGMTTASEGEGSQRYLVLHPPEQML